MTHLSSSTLSESRYIPSKVKVVDKLVYSSSTAEESTWNHSSCTAEESRLLGVDSIPGVSPKIVPTYDHRTIITRDVNYCTYRERVALSLLVCGVANMFLFMLINYYQACHLTRMFYNFVPLIVGVQYHSRVCIF